MARIIWTPSYRLVASRFPPIGLFDSVADPAALEVIYAIEGLTNPRVRVELGQLPLVPEAERISGLGTTPIMAAFTHLNPEGSRFSDGTYGVYYAAQDVDTAIAETAYHRARFLARTATPPLEIDMRCYHANLDVDLVDIRREQTRCPDLYDPTNYSAGQAFARAHRGEGARGIIYDSVRRIGGECAAVFWPKSVVAPVTQGAHFAFVWDGARITNVFEKSNLRNNPAAGTP